MARKRQTRICREGVYYVMVLLAVLVGATARQLNLLMLLGAMLAGPLLFSFLYGRFLLARLIVQRLLPAQSCAAQRMTVDLAVTNRRRWLGLWMVEVDDRVVREGASQTAEEKSQVAVYLPRIGGKETKHSSYQGFFPRRGQYRFGPLRVSTRFPLGLVRQTVVLDEPASLLVHPKLGRLTREWGQEIRENATGAQRMRRGLLEAEFYGLRDWRPGDSRRWIHWRTSARRGVPVVRQFEQRRSQDLALLVDLWQPESPTPAQEEFVEHAVSFAATLIAETCRHPGRQVFLDVAASAPLHRAGPATAAFFREQMDALALIEAHHEPGFPASLVAALVNVGPSVPTLVVTTRPLDWESLEIAARRQDVSLAGRKLRSVNVASEELTRFFIPD